MWVSGHRGQSCTLVAIATYHDLEDLPQGFICTEAVGDVEQAAGGDDEGQAQQAGAVVSPGPGDGFAMSSRPGLDRPAAGEGANPPVHMGWRTQQQAEDHVGSANQKRCRWVRV